MFLKPKTHIGKMALVTSVLAFVAICLGLRAEQKPLPNLTADEVSELQSYISQSRYAKAAATWDLNNESRATSAWYQTTIIVKDETITAAHFLETDEVGISLWWRKSGTLGQSHLWSCTIDDNGQIRSGVDPGGRKTYLSILGGKTTLGKEHIEFWEQESNKRLHALLRHYRKL